MRSEAEWFLASDEEWEAEVARRWAEVVEDCRDPTAEDDEPDEIDQMMQEDLRWCE
jgi:hypothetical protein